jgi:hypothetical protein
LTCGIPPATAPGCNRSPYISWMFRQDHSLAFRSRRRLLGCCGFFCGLAWTRTFRVATVPRPGASNERASEQGCRGSLCAGGTSGTCGDRTGVSPFRYGTRVEVRRGIETKTERDSDLNDDPCGTVLSPTVYICDRAPFVPIPVPIEQSPLSRNNSYISSRICRLDSCDEQTEVSRSSCCIYRSLSGVIATGSKSER